MAKSKKISASVRLDADVAAEVIRIAKSEHRTFSHQIQHLLAQALAARPQSAAAA